MVRVSLDMSYFRECICPIVVTKGSGNQSVLSTRYELRDNPAVTANYGDLLVKLAQTVPDGIVCFFTSYLYMVNRFAACSTRFANSLHALTGRGWIYVGFAFTQPRPLLMAKD